MKDIFSGNGGENAIIFFVETFNYILGPSHGSSLTWQRRMKIALDTARSGFVLILLIAIS